MVLPTYMAFHTTTQYWLTGKWPQALQPRRWLYRSGNYGVQAVHNSNPDNFFDKRHYCWTSDPNCGLEIGPKRPWEDLKRPTKNLVKLTRDPTKSARQEITGGYAGQ